MTNRWNWKRAAALFALLAGTHLAINATAAESRPNVRLLDTAETSIAEPVTIILSGSALVAISVVARRRRSS